MALIVGGDHAAQSHGKFARLGQLLEKVPQECPHEIFHKMFRKQTPRASTHRDRFNLDGVIITPRENRP
jgi:hypothetical protein